jgi:hypothetical protein
MSSATDIITYVGVPLAVLGVMPVLYTTMRAVIIKSRIKRMFSRNAVSDVVIRGNLMSPTVEIELPHYSITPKSRNDDKYWGLNDKPSVLKGGSWTIFNWETMTIGSCTYKVTETYQGDIRQPQADVDFTELLLFLMDRGARPHGEGFKMLRQSGLWTGTGTRLLLSPDAQDSVLKIVPPEDSDGKLSLAISWSAEWDNRSATSLSPFWMQIEVPNKSTLRIWFNVNTLKHTESSGQSQSDINAEETTKPDSLDDRPFLTPGGKARFSILSNGVQDACMLTATNALDPLLIEHLRDRKKATFGPALWFSCAAAALTNSTKAWLWGFTIPDAVLDFSRKRTVPCGVMVVIGMMADDESLDWYRLYNPNLEDELQEKQRKLGDEEFEIAVTQKKSEDYFLSATRQYYKSRRLHSECEDALTKNEDAKWSDAITSQALDSAKLATAALAWLKSETSLPDMLEKEIIEMLLYQMLLDPDSATAVATVLDEWKCWADGGAMTRANLKFVMANKIAFAYATLIVDLIKGTEESVEGDLDANMKACINAWKTVKVG